jgi:hypothetical protein
MSEPDKYLPFNRRELIERCEALEAALAKEKGGWDAFYKLRRSVGEERYSGMAGEVTASETKAND